MNDQLQKAINLARKTGDRIIVLDNANPNNSFVVMDWYNYEKIVSGEKNEEKRGLTEEKIYDNINRDREVLENREDIDVNDNIQNYFSPKNIQKRLDGNEAKKKWSISDNIRDKAEGVE